MEFRFDQISIILGLLAASISLLIYTKAVDPYQLYFNKDLILHQHEYWRLFTSLFYFGPLGFESLIQIYFFIRYVSEVEGKEFSGRPADFLFFIFIAFLWAWVTASFTGYAFLGDFISEYVFYYNCKKNPQANVMLFILPIPFRMGYYPYVMLILRCFFHASIKNILIPYAASHLFFFLHDVVSLKYDLSLLRLSDKMNSIVRSLFE